MKKYLKILLITACFLLSGINSVQAETINSFTADIKLSPKYFTVTENIVYDFGDLQQHGIYRYIPVKYQNELANRNIDIKVLAVKHNGLTEPYTDKIQGKYLNIKIGSADSTVTGRQEY